VEEKTVPQNICAAVHIAILTNSVHEGKHFIKQLGKERKLLLNKRSS